MKKRKLYRILLHCVASWSVIFLYLFAASTVWSLPDESNPSQEPCSSAEGEDSGSSISFEETGSTGESSSGEVSDMVDSIHGTVTSTFLNSANWLDSFFDDERAVQEENQSTLRVYSELFKQKGNSADFNLRFQLRLVLPRAKKRLSLLVSGDGDDELNSDNSQGQNLTERFQGRDEENVATSLWYTFLANQKNNLSLSLGFRLSEGSPVVYAGPRYRRLLKFNFWNMRFIERIRYYSNNGWESRTILDLERPVLEDCLFRTTFDGTWLEGVPGYYYNVDLFLYQPLKDYRALQYELANSIKTRPNHQLDITAFRVLYRQKIWKDWLYYEVGPQVSFPRDREFDFTPGIYLRLEVIFGRDLEVLLFPGIDEVDELHY